MQSTAGFYEFIEKSSHSKNVAELYQLLEDALEKLGYDQFVYSLLTDHPSIGKPAGLGELKHYPDDWVQYYLERDHSRIDPVIRLIGQYRGPVRWAELERAYHLSKREKRLLDEAEEAGLKDGIAIPLHGPYGELAVLGMASSSGGVELPEDQRALVSAFVQQFHLVYCDIHRPNARAEFTVCLTSREREVLQWCALGKSNVEIGKILSISEHGVEFHLRNIFRKLEVSSRVAAVARAVARHLIEAP